VTAADANVTGVFGAGPVWLACGSGRSDPHQDMDLSRAALADLAQGADGLLRFHCPRPTAAFSRRDSLAPGFPAAEAAATAHGFTPVVRPAGGRLAAYHGDALVLDLAAPHPAPHAAHRARFAAAAAGLADGLRMLGVDARPGAVPGEYCPGEFSVNARGATKLVGTAQRLTRHGYLFSAVVLVGDPEPVRAVLAATYPLLGLDWDPATVGSVADEVPEVTVAEVADVLVPRVLRLIAASPTFPVIEARLRPARRSNVAGDP
jgi:octanoyl-[GcvH]:protein N-octanoyltransferase